MIVSPVLSSATSNTAPSRAWPRDVLGLTVVVAITHAAILFGKTWSDQDHIVFNRPLRWYLSDVLRAGRIPAWWNLVDLGAPFAADPNSGFFYPPAWLVAVLPWDFAADLLPLLHLIWGGLGVAHLSRRLGAGGWGGLLAGIFFVTGGCSGSLLVHGVAGYTLSWMPWVVVAAHRLAVSNGRRDVTGGIVTFAVVAGAQILSGDPACVITTLWMVAAVTCALGRPFAFACLRVAAGYGVAALLAGGMLAPLAGIAGDSERAGGIGWQLGSMWSLHPLRIVEAMWPAFLGPARGAGELATSLANAGNAGSNPNWIMSVQIGLPAIVLAFFARGGDRRATRALWIVAGVLLLLALGAYTPAYRWYRFVFPLERMIRYPERHFLGVAVIVPALAGVGFSRLFRGDALSRKGAIVTCVAGTIVFLCALCVNVASDQLAPWLAAKMGRNDVPIVAEGIETAASGGLTTAVTTLLLALSLFLVVRKRFERSAAGATFAAVTLLGALTQGALLNKVERTALLRLPQTLAPAIHASRQAPLQERMRSRDRTLFGAFDKDVNVLMWAEHGYGNMSAIFGLANYPGLSVLSPPAAKAVWEQLARGHERAILDQLGVRYFVGNAARTPAPDFTLLTRNPAGLGLYENHRARPRAFVTSKVRQWSSAPLEQRWRDALPLDPHEIRLLAPMDAAPSAPDGVPQFFTPCSLASDRPEDVTLRCSAPSAGYAVLLDAFTRGWTATVNGVPTAIREADGLFRAVATPAGPAVIRFSYRMPGLRAGLMVSGTTVFLLIGLWFRERRLEHSAFLDARS